MKFDKVGRSDWLRNRIELTTKGNPIPHARNVHFLDDVVVTFYLSYGSKKKGFQFYSSVVEIISMEQGERYTIDFFLPSVISKRDHLSTAPFAYLLEFEVAGNSIPFDASHGSNNISSNEAARNSLITRAVSEGIANEGILQPSYLVPYYLTLDGIENYPAYKRRKKNQ